ncbi:MAG: exonuclease, partial [Clostridium sp.]
CEVLLFPEIVEQLRLWEERDRNFHITIQKDTLTIDGREQLRAHIRIHMRIDIEHEIPSVTLRFQSGDTTLEKKYLLQYRNATIVENILKRMLQHGNS